MKTVFESVLDIDKNLKNAARSAQQRVKMKYAIYNFAATDSNGWGQFSGIKLFEKMFDWKAIEKDAKQYKNDKYFVYFRYQGRPSEPALPLMLIMLNMPLLGFEQNFFVYLRNHLKPGCEIKLDEFFISSNTRIVRCIYQITNKDGDELELLFSLIPEKNIKK